MEVQGGKENEEGGALVDFSVTTQTKSYFTLNLETLDSLKKHPNHQTIPLVLQRSFS